MFWLAFFYNGYWFIIYKLQNNAFLLLPSTQETNSVYDQFLIYFYIILAFKTAAVLLMIVE